MESASCSTDHNGWTCIETNRVYTPDKCAYVEPTDPRKKSTNVLNLAQKKLMTSIRENDVTEVSKILKTEHVDPNFYDEDGLLPLGLATLSCNTQIVELLVNAGAITHLSVWENVNIDFHEPFFAGLTKKCPEDLLLKLIKKECFNYTISSLHEEFIEEYLRLGSYLPFDFLQNLLNLGLKIKNHSAGLLQSVKMERADLVEFFLKNGVDPKFQNPIAYSLSNETIFVLLLNAGVNPKSMISCPYGRSSQEGTPLQCFINQTFSVPTWYFDHVSDSESVHLLASEIWFLCKEEDFKKFKNIFSNPKLNILNPQEVFSTLINYSYHENPKLGDLPRLVKCESLYPYLETLLSSNLSKLDINKVTVSRYVEGMGAYPLCQDTCRLF
ncbi:MAG: hypothetical protein PHY93_13145 [Bacteriovorax sp.]|nr:hypothetical protein [Bacteriovorax sp.]